MGEQPEGLGERPARQRVGRVALVEHRDAGLEQRRLEIGVKAGQLGTDEQRLVDDRPARERAHEDGQSGVRRPPFDHVAREVETPLPHLGTPGTQRRTHEYLADRGLARRGEWAEDGRIDGHDAPSEHRHAQPNQHRFDEVDGGVARRGCLRQEDHAEGDALHGPHAE